MCACMRACVRVCALCVCLRACACVRTWVRVCSISGRIHRLPTSPSVLGDSNPIPVPSDGVRSTAGKTFRKEVSEERSLTLKP